MNGFLKKKKKYKAYKFCFYALIPITCILTD